MEKILKTDQGKFKLRPYTSDDQEKVMELWELAFNHEMDQKVWRWKYHKNPFGYQIMLCLNEKEEPVVMYGGLPYKSFYKGQAIRMVHMTDSMSHPAYRSTTQGRKGLFIQTAEHFFDVFAVPPESVFYYGYPGIRAYRLGKLFLQYNEISQGVQFVSADIEQVKNRSGYFKKTRLVHSFDTTIFNRIWNSLNWYYPFSISRNADFIKWRYFDHPTKKYLVFVSRNILHQPKAYGIIQINNKIATLVDILVKPRVDDIACLVSEITKELKKRGVTQIQSWLPPNHGVTQKLIQIGFIAKKEPLGLTIVGRTFHKEIPLDHASKNMFFTMADGDLF
ncbi:GNAT family N-acetyltransferase [Lentimicrobium sp. L6]|uniref:GNAT family N-acetyltransferase n=1 Tax=Lentimicrobium sp. L6 TaxID=2735916 RepID=UPI0015517AF9|nr:GNAT family N-acetyltransferase [Lentimicrobium sp. L6]NPD83643.1 GNAT family N-acetyltransferase [Lentimicrobium sp. L6]